MKEYRMLKRWGTVSVASTKLCSQLYDYLTEKGEDFELTHSELDFWTFKLRR